MKRDEKDKYPRKVSQAPEPIKTVTGHGRGLYPTRPPECPSLENNDNHKIDWNYWKNLDYWRVLDGAILILTNYEPHFIEREDDNVLFWELQQCNNINEAIAFMQGIIQERARRGHHASPETINWLENFLRWLQLIQSGLEAGTLEYLNKSVTALMNQHVKPSVFIKWAIKKGLPVPEELLSLAPGQSSGNEQEPVAKITFKKTNNKKWLIGLNDKVNIFDNLDGFLYIHYLLERPNKDISATTLYDLKPKHVTARNKAEQIKEEYKPSTIIPLESTDGETIGAIKKKLKNFKEEEAILQEKEDSTPEDALRLKELQKEIDGCKKYLKDTTWKGRPVISGDSDKCRQKVQKAIIKASIKVAESDPETARYLNKIDTGNDCRFILDNPSALIFELA